VNRFDVISPTQARGLVSVAPNADATSRDVYVATADEVSGLRNGLTIVEPFRVLILVKPADPQPSTISLKQQGAIPVAILSNPNFSAPLNVAVESLTFGRTGVEITNPSCKAEDKNGDGLTDLVCHFRWTQGAFLTGDTSAILKGSLQGGRSLRGTAQVAVK
jgi:hypothetical protein